MADRDLFEPVEVPAMLAGAVSARLQSMESERVVPRIWAQDHTVWKPDPTEITSPGRLGWLTSPAAMLEAAPGLREFATVAARDGYTDVVVCGMGGSSLAPATLSSLLDADEGALRLHVIDTTDPDAVLALERGLDLSKTLFVVSSKSGTTVETRSHMEYFWSKAPHGEQFIAVTDPGSQLEGIGRERGFRAVFLAQTDIGGRYSTLSHFGLAPAALGGIDLDGLLARAQAMLSACGPDVAAGANPGAVLGAVIGEAALIGRDKLTLLLPASLTALGNWIEQLLAESTGKEGRGIVPITGEPLGAPEVYGDDRLFVAIGDADTAGLESAGQPVVRLAYDGQLDAGAHFILWEIATAVVGHVLGINPFDQPNVEEAKAAALKALASIGASGSEEVEAPQSLGSLVRAGDYIALQAYVAPTEAMDAALLKARLRLRERFHVATASGYGPRYLHSTGQLHKGGPDSGVFVQIVSRNAEDMTVPGRDFTFGALKRAQARGDLDALRSGGRRAIVLQVGQDASGEIEKLIEGLI